MNRVLLFAGVTALAFLASRGEPVRAQAVAPTAFAKPAAGRLVPVGAHSIRAALAPAAALAGLPAPSLPLYINSGGWGFTDLNGGVSWSADDFYSGGVTQTVSGPISNTNNPTLYKTCRMGDFSYEIQGLPKGSYLVKLKFAELNYSAAGQRIFNVSLNGQTVLVGFDIVKNAGDAFTAVDKSFPVTVAGTALTITFTSVLDRAQINGIEIVLTGAAPSPEPVPAPAPSPTTEKTTGHLDGVKSDGTVYGWAQYPSDLNTPVPVRIYVDNNFGTGVSGSSPVPAATGTQTATSSSPPITPNGDVCRTDLLDQHLDVLMMPVNLVCATINRNFVGEIDYQGSDGKCYHADWRGTASFACTNAYTPPRLPNGQVPSPFDSTFSWLAARGHCYYTIGDIAPGGVPPYGMSSEKICGVGGSDPRAASHVVAILTVVNGGSASAAPVASVGASDYRADVGNHAFNYQLASGYFDGKPHQVWVWATDPVSSSGSSDTQLPGSPVTFTLAAPSSPAGSTPDPVPTPAPAPATNQAVSFIAPVNGQVISGLVSVSVALSSAYETGNPTVSVDGGPPRTLFWSSSGYGTLLNTLKMTEGQHSLSLTAKNSLGQASVTTIVVTVANNGPPAPVPTPSPTPTPAPTPVPAPSPAPGTLVSFVAPVNGQTVSGLVSVSVAVSASIDGGSVSMSLDAGTPKALYWSGTVYGMMLNAARMSNGPHTLTAYVTDRLGQTHIASIAIVVSNY